MHYNICIYNGQEMDDEEGERTSLSNLLRASLMLLDVSRADGDVISEAHALSDICLICRALKDAPGAAEHDQRRKELLAMFSLQAAASAAASAAAALKAAKAAAGAVEEFLVAPAAPAASTVALSEAAPAVANSSPVHEWLQSVNVNLASLYSKPFAEYGYEDTDLLVSAEGEQIEEAFEALAVKKPHRHRIMVALQALKRGLTSSKAKGGEGGYHEL
jgi:hypothetical protein